MGWSRLQTQSEVSPHHCPCPIKTNKENRAHGRSCPCWDLPGMGVGEAVLTWPLLLPLHRQNTLAELSIQPELHPDEGFSAFLGQFAPWFWPGEHVADAALGQAQHLEKQAKRSSHQLPEISVMLQDAAGCCRVPQRLTLGPSGTEGMKHMGGLFSEHRTIAWCTMTICWDKLFQITGFQIPG